MGVDFIGPFFCMVYSNYNESCIFMFVRKQTTTLFKYKEAK
jgi:hypothetical protein